MTDRSDDDAGGEIRIPVAVYDRLEGDPLAVAALVALVRRAAWRTEVRAIGGRDVTVNAGDVLTSREAFARATSLSEDQSRGAWARLSRAGIATVQGTRHGTHRGSVVTVHFVSSLRDAVTRDTHQNTQQVPHHNPQTTPIKTPNEIPIKTPIYVGDLSRSSDLGSQISGSPDPGSDLPSSSEALDRRPTRDLVQGRDQRADEQGRLVRVIAKTHQVAHSRLRRELGFDTPGKTGYVPAMQVVGDPAERTLQELIAAQASVEGLEERLRHVLAVAEHEARAERSLRWFGPTLWSKGSYDRAISMAVGEDRRPARAPAQEGPAAHALRRVRELEAQEAEEARRVDGGGL